jgi:23S rRNA 5-hydroxycytidine C2501 synthase
VTDSQGRFIAHDKHVLSMKDNNQSANLADLIDAGVRSFKIEGRYKDMGYVKNITAHYRKLFDQIIEDRESSTDPERPPLARASSGRTQFFFTPDPNQNFNREFTDYFVQGRKEDIGAFDTPKNPGQPLGEVTDVGPNWVEVQPFDRDVVLHNGDGLCYYDLQKELVGLAINRAEPIGKKGRWRLFPKDAMAGFKDLRRGVTVNRNRDMDWVRALEKRSSERRIGVWLTLKDTPQGIALSLTDEDGYAAEASLSLIKEPARDPVQAQASVREHLGKLGTTDFALLDLDLQWAQAWFLPASQLNALRRDALASLELVRSAQYQRPVPGRAVEPPALYPEDTLTYLANVYNDKARDFYAKHGVKLIAAAYESHEEEGEVSLMITKHCVRFSMSLCPKQAKGVTGVQGQVRAEPLTLINGKEKLTLRFDCKPCEMHVVGKMKTSVMNQRAREMAEPQAIPMKFYKTRPERAVS